MDRRVDLETIKAGSYKLAFFWSWNQKRYGVSASYGSSIIKETLLQTGFPEPALPGKRLCNAFWDAFKEYVEGDESYAPIFAPIPDPDAQSWGKKQLHEMWCQYQPAMSMPGLN